MTTRSINISKGGLDMVGDLPYIDKPETIEKLACDYARLFYISGNTLNKEINFILNGSIGFCLSIYARITSESDYRIGLYQITTGVNDDIFDLIGEFIITTDFKVREYYTDFNTDVYLQDESIVLMENLEHYFNKDGRLNTFKEN